MSRLWGFGVACAFVLSFGCGPPPPSNTGGGGGGGGGAVSNTGGNTGGGTVQAGSGWVCWDAYDAGGYLTSGCWRNYDHCQQHLMKMVAEFPDVPFSTCNQTTTAACYTYYAPDMDMYLPSCHTHLEVCQIEKAGLEQDVAQGLDQASAITPCETYN